MNFNAYVRGLTRAAFGEGSSQVPHITAGGELIVTQGLPPEAELARQGYGWSVVGTAVTPVIAVPTTAAHLTLYNGNPDKALIIAAVGGVLITTMAVAGQFALLARSEVPGNLTNPAGTLIINSLTGRQYAGKANAKASQALNAIAAGNNVAWTPVGTSTPAIATTTIGNVAHSECFGRWIVQPFGAFSLASLAQTAAGTVSPYIYFYEVPLNVVA